MKYLMQVILLFCYLLISSVSFGQFCKGALELHGEDAVTLPAPESVYYPSNGFTWECWFNGNWFDNNDATVGLGHSLLMTGDEIPCEDIQIGFGWRNVAKNLICFAVDEPGVCGGLDPSPCTYIPPGGFIANKWYHVAGVKKYSTNETQLYVDGQLVDTKPNFKQPYARDILTFIGRYPNRTDSGFAGKVDEIRYWNYPRTAVEIQADYDKCLTGNEPGLVAYYRANDNSGSILKDATIFGRNGTLEPGVSWDNSNNAPLISSCFPTSSTLNITICRGESYENYTTSGTYNDKFVNSNGCDSIRTLNLIVDNNCPTSNPQFCSGSLGSPIVNITFGGGATNPGPQLANAVTGATTNYNFASYASGTPPSVPIDGDYALVNQVPGNSAWYSGSKDHTGNPDGYMAFFNSDPVPGKEFYRQTITSLCPGTTYEFAAWIANVINPAVLPNAILPNITFKIINAGTQAELASYNTGDISNSNSMTWKQYSFLFTTPVNTSSVTLVLANNNIGGNAQPGNDLAIDDITFRPCGPSTNASFSGIAQVDSVAIDACSSVNLFGKITGNFNNPAYQWQISKDAGKTYSNIPGAATLNSVVSNLPKGLYDIELLSAESANIGTVTCRFISNKIRLLVTDCPANISATAKGIINTYTPVISFNLCTNKITVKDASTFNTGDTVMIIQMKGASIDSSNTASFGTITDYKNAGNYEFNYVKGKAGNVIELKNIVTRKYDLPDGKVQLVRVPYFKSVRVSDTLTCLPWDGEKGGVLVLNVQDTVELAADINVSGRGFKGGKGTVFAGGTFNCLLTDYFTPFNYDSSAMKGESISSLSDQKMYGKGKNAAGGGGGMNHNSGGGGNGGTGGNGGNIHINCPSNLSNVGMGGNTLSYTNASNKTFMGSGGGAGKANNGSDASGGNGGALVIISANNIIGNSKSIISKGANGIECNPIGNPNASPCHDGGGGGGAGGTVLLNIKNALINAVNVNVDGGNGANLTYLGGSSAGLGPLGPGAGGGGGVVWVNTNAVPSNATISNKEGINGLILNDGNIPWGAAPGVKGINVTNLVLPPGGTLFKPSIDSIRITSTPTTCNAFSFKGLGYLNRDAIQTWQWTLGDGGTANTQNTNHAYNANGTFFNIKLVATDVNGCKDSSTTTATAQFINIKTNNDTAVCYGEKVQLLATGASSYSWLPATGLSNAGIANPLASPADTTQYIVSTTGSNGCVVADTVVIAVKPLPVVAAGNDAAICNGDDIQLTASGASSYSWLPTTGLSNAAISNPIAAPADTTQYVVTGTTNACTNTDTIIIAVKPTPAVNAGNDTAVCKGRSAQLTATGAANYIWKPAGNLDNASMANPQAAPPNTTQYIVTGTSANGCTANDTVFVNIDLPPVITKTNDTVACGGKPVQLNVSGGNNYVWTPAISLNADNIANPVASPLVNTTYYIQSTGAANNCMAIDSIKVTLREKPVFSVSPGKAVCAQVKVQLTATGGTEYLWSPAALVSSPTAGTVFTSPSTTTTYTVQIKENICNESATLTTTVNITGSLQLSVSKSNDIDCYTDTVQLIASGADKYIWTSDQPPLYLNDANIANPVAHIRAGKLYYVTGTDTSTGCTAKDSITVAKVLSTLAPFYAPNAFSPNGDGHNDCYKLFTNGTLYGFEMSIYNRWGQRVFTTTSQYDCWDGKYKGKAQDPGNFVVYIYANNECVRGLTKTNLVLIR